MTLISTLVRMSVAVCRDGLGHVRVVVLVVGDQLRGAGVPGPKG